MSDDERMPNGNVLIVLGELREGQRAIALRVDALRDEVKNNAFLNKDDHESLREEFDAKIDTVTRRIIDLETARASYQAASAEKKRIFSGGWKTLTGVGAMAAGAVELAHQLADWVNRAPKGTH